MNDRLAGAIINVAASAAAVLLIWSEYGWRPALAAWCLGVWIRPVRRG